MSEAAADRAGSAGDLVVRAVLRTDVGLVRSENQDFGTYTTPDEERESGHPGGRLLVVADGMGGHRGGATASRLAAQTVKAQYLGSETEDVAAALRDALARANARIFTEAQANPDLRGMGTTTSALAVRGGEAWFAHVGDSRIYLVREDEIRQLTEDHSLVASMVREGLLTPKEAETHPRRNVLQRSIGVGDDVEIDVSGPFDIRAGDTFILCSDGLHGLVKEPEMKDVAKLSISEAADRFLRLAIERGAPDNVTVIVARVEHGNAGDATLIDDPHLDDTQDIDPAAFDHTVRDVPDERPDSVHEPRLANAEPLRAHAPAESAGSDVADSTDAAAVAAPASPEPASALPKVLWPLLLVLVLGAAGAWLFLSR